MKTLISSVLPPFILNRWRRNQQKQRDATMQRKINQFLEKKTLKLNIGAGAKKGENGWVTLDLNENADLQLDLLKPWPFPSGVVQEIYSSHFLEHFHTSQILTILSECHRVLKPGGLLKTCVPDASIYIKAYLSSEPLDETIWMRFKPAAIMVTKIDYVNYIGHLEGEHKHLFDLENLIKIQLKGGFRNVSERKFDPAMDMEERDYQSIYTVAEK